MVQRKRIKTPGDRSNRVPWRARQTPVAQRLVDKILVGIIGHPAFALSARMVAVDHGNPASRG